MIDPKSGQVLLPYDGLLVGPLLTREQYLASPHAVHGEECVKNDPYCSFRLPRVTVGDHAFACILWFRGSKLFMVSIGCADEVYGTSWDDWSLEREMARKRMHDTLLKEALGRSWHYKWGNVVSEYDQKGAASRIEVTYAT